MAKVPATSSIVRHTSTGRTIAVRGLGALRGRLILNPEIDLIKPIAWQLYQSNSAD
jgi:hypothetical protein